MEAISATNHSVRKFKFAVGAVRSRPNPSISILSPYTQSRSMLLQQDSIASHTSQFNSKEQLMKIKGILSPSRYSKQFFSAENSPRGGDNSNTHGFNNSG